MNNSNHEQYMTLAIEEAKKGKGKVEPNPMVGTVIVEGGEVVAKGHYEKDGGPHAECNALNALGRQPKDGAVMYVTLEPCSSEGRTGACTERLIDAKISCVVLGAIDPNPAHNGRGIEVLRQAGIEVVAGIMDEECAALNPEFNKRMRNS